MKDQIFGDVPQVRTDLVQRNDPNIADHIRHFVKTELVPRIPKSVCLISVDGFDGVGKSTLTQMLADELGFQSIHLDDYLEKEQNCYFEALRFSDLQDSVAEKTRWIVEGCLVQTVLSRLGISADYKIYVIRASRMIAYPDQDWADEIDVLIGDKSAEEIIADEEGDLRAWFDMPGEFGGSGDFHGLEELRKELIRYHKSVLPHRTADLVVKIARIDIHV